MLLLVDDETFFTFKEMLDCSCKVGRIAVSSRTPILVRN